MQDHIPSEVMNAVPGAGGSLIALLWLKESKLRGAALWAAGTFFAYWAATPLAEKFAMNQSVAGLFVGTFSMAIVNKAFEVIQQVKWSDLISDWLKKRE